MNILIGIIIGYLISCILWWVTYFIAETNHYWEEEIQGFAFGWFILIPVMILKKIIKIFKKMLDKSQQR